ncbi:MAG: GAF domain-containing protein, partial [Desulfobulbaceae bacterium]|nr:GAF domain-containing protein [Desulfobulbaceae bacterium]
PKGGIFVSQMDLNIEHGAIESPLKPVIRFGTPIFNSRGEKKGIVLLNYQADQLLSRMAAESDKAYGELMLINADGYWLYSPNKGEAWGFMSADGQKHVFGNSFPEAWKIMADNETGSFFTAEGFFTFRRIHPVYTLSDKSDNLSGRLHSYPWTIISRVTPEKLSLLNGRNQHHYLKFFFLFALGATISALLFTWALMKRKAAEQTAFTARKQQEEFMLWRSQLDSALTALSADLLAEMSLEEITGTVINKSRSLTRSRFAFAGYIDHDTGNLVCPVAISDIIAECKLADQQMIFSKCAGLWGWVIDNREAIIANEPQKDPRATGLPAGHIPIERFLSVPAMINQELVGIVALANSDQDYTERDLKAIDRIATLFALAIQRKRTEESMHRLLVGTAAVTGKQFFDTMVEQLAKSLGTRYVLVGEILPESPNRVTGLSFWKGDTLGAPLSYPLADTPCEEARQSGFCLYEKDVAALFPKDKALADLGAEFYAGIPLRDDHGAPIGILCALHDRPLRKLAHINEIFQIFSNRASGEIERQRTEKSLARAKEAAEIANNAKSRFLANMSHELRTPLNAIIGFATVLLEQHFGPLNEKQLGFTNEIKDGGDHLLNIINDILDLAKIEAGKMPFTRMPAHFVTLVEQSLNMIKVAAMRRGITVDLDVAAETKGLIIDIDERKIKQALLNLLTNAVKFTPDNGRITVSVHHRGETLWTRVADSGIGIAAEDIQRIFEPFYQVKSEYRGKTPGTGLGLPLTKTLVEMHDGTLKVKSDGRDQGTCFTIALPITESRLATS